MSRATIILTNDITRQRAAKWCMTAPKNSRVEFKEAKRSLDQNARLWAMLTDIARQKEHMGRRYTPDQWKVLAMHALGREVQFLPALDGSTFVPYGQSSSDLSKGEMTDLIEWLFKWGAENGVAWSDPTQVAA